MAEKAYNVCAVFSSEISGKMIRDFCDTLNGVFNIGFTGEDFKKKYLDDIYGDSVICVVYDEAGNPAAASALWRNDVAGQKAYQPCDVCVMKEHRRRGLFSLMAEKVMTLVEEDVYAYNFANDNSRHQYLKTGWKINGSYRPGLWPGKKAFDAENPEMISDEYFDWWLLDRVKNKYQAAKIGGSYYMVKDMRGIFRKVLAPISARSALKLKNVKGVRILLCDSGKPSFYNKKHDSNIVLSRDDRPIKVPVWKIDVY